MGLKEFLPELLLAVLFVVNAVAFVLMGVDKNRARQRAAGASERKVRRIPEKTLFLWAACFGAAGATAGMLLFRHKTRHWYFRFGLPALMIVQVVLLTMHRWMDPLRAFIAGLM